MVAAVPAAWRVATVVAGAGAVLCVRSVDGMLRKVYSELPDWIVDAIAGLPEHPAFQDLRRAS